MFPVWTRDGNRIIFSSSREGTPALFWQAADGSGMAEKLGPGGRNNQLPLTASPDGKFVVFRDTVGGAEASDLRLLSAGRKAVDHDSASGAGT